MDDWRKTTLIKVYTKKWTAQNKYRPIFLLPMMWKILTALIRRKFITDMQAAKYFQRRGRIQRWNKWDMWSSLLWSTHTQGKTKRDVKNVGMAWLTTKKTLQYGPVKLDNSQLKCTRYHTMSLSSTEAMKNLKMKLAIGGKTF